MNDFSHEASEAGEIPYEGEQSRLWRKTRLTVKGLTTPATVFTSPWMDSNKSPDPFFVNTVTQTALAGVNANKRPDPNLVIALSKAMSPTDKIDSWFATDPIRPSQPSTSRPYTRDTGVTSLGGAHTHFLSEDNREATFDPAPASPSTRDKFLSSFVQDQTPLPTTQMGANTRGSGQDTADRAKASSSRPFMRDPFFDTVPKGPGQPSNSRLNARPPVFPPWISARAQSPSSFWNKTGASGSQEEPEEDPCPRLTLRIPHPSAVSDSSRSAPQMATHTEIPEPRADTPHTTDSSVPAVRLSNPSFQSPQCHAPQWREMLNPAARSLQSKFTGPRAPPRRNNNLVVQPSAASYTNSRTWTSTLVMEKERWQRVEESLGRMNLLRSSVVPRTLKDWLAHQQGHADAKREREQRKLDEKNRSLRDPRLPCFGRPVKIGPAFRGRTFEHKNYGSVLVFPTVWARTYEPPPDRLDPLWPCAEEMKEEGDERNTSGFRRFPALPRAPGNDTVQYKLKAIQPFLPFDAVWKMPTRKSVEAARKKFSSEEVENMEGYLGKSLLDAIDCITDDSF